MRTVEVEEFQERAWAPFGWVPVKRYRCNMTVSTAFDTNGTTFT